MVHSFWDGYIHVFIYTYIYLFHIYMEDTRRRTYMLCIAHYTSINTRVGINFFIIILPHNLMHWLAECPPPLLPRERFVIAPCMCVGGGALPHIYLTRLFMLSASYVIGHANSAHLRWLRTYNLGTTYLSNFDIAYLTPPSGSCSNCKHSLTIQLCVFYHLCTDL